MSDRDVPWERLFALASVPMLVVDAEGRVVAANEASTALLGGRAVEPSPEDAPGHLDRFTRPEDHAWTHRYLSRLLSGEIDRFETDQYVVRADGSQLLVRISCRALGDDHGERTHVVAALVTVPDDLRLFEPGVADRLLEFGSETVTLVDAAGRVRTTRGAQIPVQGYPTTFWKGREISELLAPGEFERVAAFREEVASTPGAMIEVDVEVLTAEGDRRTIAARVFNCVDDPLLEGFVIVTRDITDERAVVAELATRRRTAEAVVDAQTRLFATVSHELRNPLHAAHGIAELLAAEELSGEAAGLAGTLVRQLASLARVTQDLLDAAQFDAGATVIEPVPTDLSALIGDVVGVGRAASGDRPVSITSRLTQGVPPWVMADADRLRQVLTNLVGNAVKFTEQGLVEVVVRPDGPGSISFSVVDTGVGIPHGEQRSILEPFTVGSTAGVGRGAGLGLSVVARLVDAMGGRIALRSDVGVGTQVDVTLPLEACEPPAPVDRADGSQGLRVLVVEDNPVNQQLARRQLERLGFVSTIVGTGEEGLQRLDAHPGAFDVVLMDQQLPGWSGAETTRRIRRLAGPVARIPVIGVSASTTPADREAFREAGMDDLVTKPATLHDLSSAIRAVCADGRSERTTGDAVVAAPAVDVDVLEELTAELGDAASVDRLVRTFLEELPGRVDAVLTAADAAAAGRAAHVLTSSARLVGAKPLGDRCAQIERGAGDVEGLGALADRTRTALEDWQRRHHARTAGADEPQLRW